MHTDSPTVDHTAAAPQPGVIQRLQQLAGAHHVPGDCQHWRGVPGLCRGCACALQELLTRKAARWRVPTSQAELTATLHGLLEPVQRPASGPDLVGLTAERDAALALLGRIGLHVPANLRAAALQQLGELLGPQGAGALRTAQLAIERGGAEGAGV